MRLNRSTGTGWTGPRWLAVLAMVIAVGTTIGGSAVHLTSRNDAKPQEVVASAPAPTAESVPVAANPPPDLPVIRYAKGPKGFPPDPDPMSTAPLTEGLRPVVPLAVYDAPGGRPLAYLPPVISGVPVTVPIVMRRVGWGAILLPSVNRTVGWLPAADLKVVPLRDQLVLRRLTHELTWHRDGAPRAAWRVTIGSPATPTPLGRSFVLGRATPRGEVYGGLDVLALGSVPDDPQSLAPSLRGAHTGIHSWYRDDFGGSVSNGCIRLPKHGHRLLLKEIVPGTPVIVID